MVLLTMAPLLAETATSPIGFLETKSVITPRISPAPLLRTIAGLIFAIAPGPTLTVRVCVPYPARFT